jgi:hypothetical protein
MYVRVAVGPKTKRQRRRLERNSSSRLTRIMKYKMEKNELITILKEYYVALHEKGYIPTIELLIETLQEEIETETYAKSITVQND